VDHTHVAALRRVFYGAQNGPALVGQAYTPGRELPFEMPRFRVLCRGGVDTRVTSSPRWVGMLVEHSEVNSIRRVATVLQRFLLREP
jgi:hypothetical protein